MLCLLATNCYLAALRTTKEVTKSLPSATTKPTVTVKNVEGINTVHYVCPKQCRAE